MVENDEGPFSDHPSSLLLCLFQSRCTQDEKTEALFMCDLVSQVSAPTISHSNAGTLSTINERTHRNCTVYLWGVCALCRDAGQLMKHAPPYCQDSGSPHPSFENV